MTPEGKVKKKVREVLKAQGAWVFMPVQTGRGMMGVPDFVVCYPITVTQEMVGQRLGVFVGVETKAPGKERTVTALQRMQLDNIATAGGVSLVATEADGLIARIESCL